MDEKKITISKEEFSKAASEVIAANMNDEKMGVETRLVVCMTGGIFITELEKKLFGKEDK